MTRVVVLIASIPARRAFCEGLLGDLTRQTRPPDVVLLRLDGYGSDVPAPRSPFPVFAIERSEKQEGPGMRWLFAQSAGLDRDDIVVCIDDDANLLEAPEFVAGLVMAVERDGGAAGAMGTDLEGKGAPPGPYSRGLLIHAAGLGLTVRVKHLEGLRMFAEWLVQNNAPNLFSPLGDDDAIVSAHLWTTGVPITHAVTGNVFELPAAKASAQSVARGRSGEKLHAQKMAIRRVTGWPFQAIIHI